MTTPDHPKPTWITLRLRRPPLSYRFDRRVPLVAALILLFALGTLIVSVSYGEYDIPPLEVVRTILNVNQDNPDYANLRLVVDSFRLPRIVLAFLVGAALAASGAIMQGITRNPLADPYLLGVSGGAGLVAVSLIVWFKTIPISLLPFAAFAGSVDRSGRDLPVRVEEGQHHPDPPDPDRHRGAVVSQRGDDGHAGLRQHHRRAAGLRLADGQRSTGASGITSTCSAHGCSSACRWR